MPVHDTTISILGLGKVGTAVGFLLRSAGYRIVSVASRSEVSLKRGVSYTGGKAGSDFSHAAAQAQCIIITTSDDAISSVCDTIAINGAVAPGKIVLHMSGAGGLDLLKSAKDEGASVASIHPIQSFADIASAIETIPGSVFGITGDEEIRDWSVRFVTNLGGIPFFVSEIDKPLYHAAACMASNYLVTLMNIVAGIYQSFGLKHDDAVKAFWPLVTGTVKNIETQGTVQALTGPIARGDVGTIRKHLEAFETTLPELLTVYRELGLFAVDIARRKKALSDERARDIILLLSGGLRNE